jgi:hypothetical protein
MTQKMVSGLMQKIYLKSSNQVLRGLMVSAIHYVDVNAAQTSETYIGPARAYTLRGKYRQFFLRVSADNVDEITSANVIVSKLRTLDIVVEAVRDFFWPLSQANMS